MAQQSIPILSLSVTSSGANSANCAITPVYDAAAAGENTLGICRSDAADGEQVTVDVLGTTIAKAGASCSVGDSLKVTTGGKLIPWATSGAKVAIALEAAAADGDLIEVLLIPNAV